MKILFLALALVSSFVAAREQPTEANGLLVRFKPGVAIESAQGLHARLGSRVAFVSSEDGHLTFLFPHDEKAATDVVALTALCHAYRASNLVLDCSPSWRVETKDEKKEHDPRSKGFRDLASKKVYCKECLDEYGLPPKHDGKLTPLWAQEQIGADLVDDVLGDVGSVEPVNVGVFDGGFFPAALRATMTPELEARLKSHPKEFLDDAPRGGAVDARKKNQQHGDQVANLINSGKSKYPVGVGKFSRISALSRALWEYDAVGAKKVIQDGKVKVVNLSIGFADRPPDVDGKTSTYLGGQVTIETVRGGIKDGVIFVMAAGNDHPKPLEVTAKSSGAILVGSSTPTGLPSDFSQEGEEVSILAPSDHALTSVGEGDAATEFAGTSGATPLVAGAISNAAALLPGLTNDEARTLVERASTPTAPTSIKPRKNGAGILNLARMMAVAKRLRTHWPTNRAKLKDPATYDFAKENKKARDKALADVDSVDCKEQKKAFRALRRLFFLDPSDGELALKIAAVYRSLGRDENAEFFENLTRDPTALEVELRRRIASEDKRVSDEATRAALRSLGPQGKKFYGELARSGKGGHREQAVSALARTGDLAAVDAFVKDGEGELREAAARSLIHFPAKDALPRLRSLAADPDRAVARAALVAAREFGAAAYDVFSTAVRTEGTRTKDSDESEDLLVNAVRRSWSLGSRQTEFLVETAKQHPALVLSQIEGLLTSEYVKPGPLFAQLLASAPDRSAVLYELVRYLAKASPPPPELLGVLRAELDRPDTDRVRVGAGLTYYGKEGRDAIQKAYDGADANTRVQLLRGIRLGQTGAVKSFKKIYDAAFADKNPALVKEAILGNEDPSAIYESIVRHPNPEIRAFGWDRFHTDKIKMTPAIERLLGSALVDPDPRVVAEAAYVAARDGHPEALRLFSRWEGKIATQALGGACQNPNLAAPFLLEAARRPEIANEAMRMYLNSSSETEIVVAAVTELLRKGSDVQKKNALDGAFTSRERVEFLANHLGAFAEPEQKLLLEGVLARHGGKVPRSLFSAAASSPSEAVRRLVSGVERIPDPD